MRSDIFLPEKLKVGFQNRNGTYTGKLAYVTYFDTKGVLRKEKSWEDWRDSKISPMEVENVPTEGFVLNKKAGGYSTGWNQRQTWVRIYDPRGFEFEISVQNLLYILENTNSIKGKGLDGQFIYGWQGPELILIPTSSPDYKELSDFNTILHSKKEFKGKDLILGATYLTKQNEHVVYLGRYDCYGQYDHKHQGKKYVFRNSDRKYEDYETVGSLKDKIVGVVSEDCVSDFADLVDKFEKSKLYSPHDPKKNEFVPYTLSEFIADAQKKSFSGFFRHDKVAFEVRKSYYNNSYDVYKRATYSYDRLTTGSLEQIFNSLKPMYMNCYLPDGKLYQKKAKFY